MRPKPHIRLTPADQRTVSLWSRGMFAACVLVLASLLVAPQLYARADRQSHVAANPASPEICAAWDDSARTALARLVQSERNADLSQVGDATFRIRRARRNCQMGWTKLACRDYDAVIGVMPERFQKTADRISTCGT